MAQAPDPSDRLALWQRGPPNGDLSHSEPPSRFNQSLKSLLLYLAHGAGAGDEDIETSRKRLPLLPGNARQPLFIQRHGCRAQRLLGCTPRSRQSELDDTSVPNIDDSRQKAPPDEATDGFAELCPAEVQVLPDLPKRSVPTGAGTFKKAALPQVQTQESLEALLMGPF
jgi:hypothetical protein